MRLARLLGALLLAIAVGSCSLLESEAQQTSAAGSSQKPLALHMGPDDIARPPGLPPLGKWMYDSEGVPAHWLGERYAGKQLREPINILILDRTATSANDAIEQVTEAAADAGSPSRFGHSSGYQALIGGSVFQQIEKGKEHAFSDGVFELTNDHGRIFGPYRFESGYLFVGAFSREKVDLFASPGHQYASFNAARDRFAHSLVQNTPFKLSRLVNLENAVIGNPQVTTGDHDGVALFLENR